MRRGILATRDELRALADRLGRHPYDAIYETLNRRCSLILEAAPTLERHWRSLWQQGIWGSAVLAARTTQGRILDLLIAHHIKPNPAYRDRAIEELKNLISWSTWVDPCHNHLPADLCTAEAAVAAVVALDWLWEDLSRADRLRVLKAIRTKAIDPYRAGVQQEVFWYNTCCNWNAVVNGGCGLAALALSDDEPAAAEASRWARRGLNTFFQALGREGGWDEGIGYWGYGMRYLLLLGEASSRLADDRSICQQRGMDATGLFPVYFSPNGRAASFGDNASVPLYGTFYLLVKRFAVSGLTWWLDTYSFRHDVSTSGPSAAGLAMLFRPVDADSPETLELKTLKVFHEIGWAAMADSWPRPEMYVAAKTGDLSANHSQHDMNSIQMQVGGEMLLVDAGHPPYSRQYFSEQRRDFYEVQARAHNTLVVAERDHIIEAQGSILDAQSGSDYRWVAMDSAGACGEDVRFIRHVVMVVRPATSTGETLVVLDEIDSAAPEMAELFWHTRGQVEMDPGKTSGVITGRQAAVRFALAASVDARVTTHTHRLASKEEDRVVKLSCGLIGKVYLVSVFSRMEAKSAAKLKVSAGGVTVRYGSLEVRFKLCKAGLHLDSVSGGDIVV